MLTPAGEQVDDELVAANQALLMYQPFLSAGPVNGPGGQQGSGTHASGTPAPGSEADPESDGSSARTR